MKYIALSLGANTNSGFKDTRDEVVKWGSEQLLKNANIGQVMVCQTVASIERDYPPIKITELSDKPEFPQAVPAKAKAAAA